jgi:DNA-binding CsgD family transcriptional regulator
VSKVSVRLTENRLIGRDRELRSLCDALDRGCAGDAAIVAVAGDAGIGKTRLVTEFAQIARARDVRVLHGECIELGGDGLPYAPFITIVRTVADDDGVGAVLELAGNRGGELARLVPELDHSGRTPTVTTSSQARLSMALTSLLEVLSRRAPLLVVLEDLHWADASTRDMVPIVARALQRARATVVLTYRAEELPEGDPARRLVAEITRTAGSVRIELGPLSRREQALQLSGLTGVPPSRELVDAIYGRAEGNPFFAEELLSARSVGDVLPETLRDLLLSRVLALPRATRDALRAAAAAGPSLPVELVAAGHEVDMATLDDMLRPAFEHHILIRDAQRVGYTFRHALLGEAVAGTLLPGESRRVHGRLAMAVASAPEGSLSAADRIAALARHWHLAGDRARSLAASVDAARTTARMLAFPESLRHYERALAVWDDVAGAAEVADATLATLLREAAEIAHLAAHPQRAADLCRAAIDAVDPAVDPTLAGLLHERLGRYLWMAADGRGSLTAYRRAVDLVPEQPWTESRARVLSGLSQSLMLAGWTEESRDVAEQAIEIAQHVDARAVEGHARNNLGVDLCLLGEVDRGVALLREARRIAEEASDDVDDVARAIVNLSVMLSDAGRMEEAVQTALEGVEVVTGLGLERRKGVWCRCDAADLLVSLGRWDEARQHISAAVALDPDGIDLARTLWIRGVLSLREGDLDAADSDLDRAGDLLSGMIDSPLVGPFTADVVELLVARGVPARGLDVAQQGWDRLSVKRAPHAPPLAALATRAAADVARRDARIGTAVTPHTAVARRWFERCAATVETDRLGSPVSRSWRATAHAELARVLHTGEVDAWAEAVASWNDAGQPYWRAYAGIRHGEALLADGDRDGARAALHTAHELSERLGARLLLSDIVALRRRARLDPMAVADRDAPADPYHLTARERQVLKMLAQGRTNRQIAGDLFVSHRTVGSHVSNLLAKLGAQTRSEAAAIAHRERLL